MRYPDVGVHGGRSAGCYCLCRSGRLSRGQASLYSSSWAHTRQPRQTRLQRARAFACTVVRIWCRSEMVQSRSESLKCGYGLDLACRASNSQKRNSRWKKTSDQPGHALSITHGSYVVAGAAAACIAVVCSFSREHRGFEHSPQQLLQRESLRRRRYCCRQARAGSRRAVDVLRAAVGPQASFR